jgi:hypothetical protein
MSMRRKGCLECGAVAGEPHLERCSFSERYEAAARSPLVEWLASLPAEYERLKARAAALGLANE